MKSYGLKTQFSQNSPNMSLTAWLRSGAGLFFGYSWWECARMTKPDLLCEMLALHCMAFTHISFKTELRGNWSPDHGVVIYFSTDFRKVSFVVCFIFFEKIVNLSSLWLQEVIYVICCLSSLAGTLLSCLTLCFPALNSFFFIILKLLKLAIVLHVWL